jgi:ribulose-phosphate 3-epimerase
MNQQLEPGKCPAKDVLVSPSLMCADQLHLGEDTEELVRLGVDWLHLDIMDGHYVPNYTFGINQCRVLGERFDLPLDMHLMVDDPNRWAPVFARFGRESYVSIHPETAWHPARTLEAIREAGARPGIAVDPGINPARFTNLLGLVDLVLIMCVNPGYSGQKLLPWTLESICEASELREKLGISYRIEVDGNVSWENIPGMVAAGADILVVGTSSLFDPSMSRKDAAAKLFELIGRRR